MKKFICLVIVLCMSVLCINACSSKLTGAVQNSISEIRYNIFAGSNGEVSCTFESGKREQTYVLNGYSTPLVNFGLITFDIGNKNIENDTASFTLNYNNVSLDGMLEQNPYDDTYVADIKQIITSPTEMIATIRIGSFVSNIVLYPLSNTWNITCNSALDIAIKTTKKTLKSMMKNNEFLGETYIKILKDNKSHANTYYWYVSFLGRTGTKVGVLIDTHSGKVLAVK